MKLHTGEKPFKCTWPTCHYSFLTASAMKDHYRTHTGVPRCLAGRRALLMCPLAILVVVHREHLLFGVFKICTNYVFKGMESFPCVFTILREIFK